MKQDNLYGISYRETLPEARLPGQWVSVETIIVNIYSHYRMLLLKKKWPRANVGLNGIQTLDLSSNAEFSLPNEEKSYKESTECEFEVCMECTFMPFIRTINILCYKLQLLQRKSSKNRKKEWQTTPEKLTDIHSEL